MSDRAGGCAVDGLLPNRPIRGVMPCRELAGAGRERDASAITT
jgi:hypothetical protein